MPALRPLNIYNRVSDLGTTFPIAGREMTCLNPTCGKPVWLWNDRINDAFEMFLFESGELLRQKRYMPCVLAAVQAIELFMAAVLRTWLLYRPLPNQRDFTLFNELSAALHERTRKYSFVQMRNALFHLVLKGMKPETLDEARVFIESFPERPTGVRRASIASQTSGRLRENLLRLFDTKVHEVRNRVVHMHAHRPTQVEAKSVLDEAEDTLYPLKHDLGPELEFEDFANTFPDQADG